MKREVIETLLKNAGVAEESLKEVIDGIMTENGKDIEAEKDKTKTKESELTAANETIKSLKDAVAAFDGKDPAKLEADLKNLQTKYETDIAAEREKAEKTTRSYALKDALSAMGATDPEYLIYKAGGIEKFAFSDAGNPIGLEDLMMPFKESSPHLFKADNPPGNGAIVNSGGNHGSGGSVDYDKLSDDEYYQTIMKKE